MQFICHKSYLWPWHAGALMQWYLNTRTFLQAFPPPPAPPSTRLLGQVRERSRYLHYSLSTEKAYVYWIRFFIRWHALKHPRDMGGRGSRILFSRCWRPSGT